MKRIIFFSAANVLSPATKAALKGAGAGIVASTVWNKYREAATPYTIKEQAAIDAYDKAVKNYPLKHVVNDYLHTNPNFYTSEGERYIETKKARDEAIADRKARKLGVSSTAATLAGAGLGLAYAVRKLG